MFAAYGFASPVTIATLIVIASNSQTCALSTIAELYYDQFLAANVSNSKRNRILHRTEVAEKSHFVSEFDVPPRFL